MATSWIHAAVRFKFELRLACPELLRPPQAVLDWAATEGGRIVVSSDVESVVTDADAVVTDTWVSMGDDDGESRHNLLRSYQVDDRVMALAKPEAIFMHCLPAHRGDEVTRSEEHTSELQSLMRISYAVFCLKKKNNNKHNRLDP